MSTNKQKELTNLVNRSARLLEAYNNDIWNKVPEDVLRFIKIAYGNLFMANHRLSLYKQRKKRVSDP